MHTPLTDQTRNILSREALAKTKPGVRIVNCARGGLIDEAALKEGLDSGHVAGAALDVFAKEPAKDSPLFGTPNFISTPHLGASTSEAQVNVAIQVAEQMSDFLLLGGVTNAINMPSLSAEEAPRLKPYMALAEKLGQLVGQIVGEDVRCVSIEVEGAAAELNKKPITGAVLAGLMGTYSHTVNMVNAPLLAKERGLDVREIRHEREGDYHTLVAVTVGTAERRAAGRRDPVRQPRAAAGRHLRHPGRGRARRADDLHRQHRRARASSARSARRWARTASTSPPSTSAAARKRARRWRWSSVDDPITPELAAELRAAAGRARGGAAQLLDGLFEPGEADRHHLRGSLVSPSSPRATTLSCCTSSSPSGSTIRPPGLSCSSNALGRLVGGGGDQDAVERRVLRPAARAVADAHLDVVAEQREPRLGGFGEFLDDFDAEHLGAHLRHHRRLVAEAGADLEHAVAGLRCRAGRASPRR